MSKMNKDHKISVVINVYNEEENIADCLDSLLNQTYDRFELVIVDDGSTDRTMEIVKKYENKLNVQKTSTPHLGIKKARIKGVNKAGGKYIVIIDADEILEPSFLKNILKPFKDKKVGAVGGILRSVGGGWVTKAYGTLQEMFYELRKDSENEVDWIQGGCSAYRREALEEVGGLAEDKVSADKDISWKMKDAGWKVVLKSDAVAYHKDPQTLRSVMKREYNIGKREYWLLKEHGGRMGWKEWSRFYPMFGLLALLFVSLFPLLIILIGLAFLCTFLAVVYLINSNIKETHFGMSFKCWLVLTAINLAWSIGFIKSFIKRN